MRATPSAGIVLMAFAAGVALSALIEPIAGRLAAVVIAVVLAFTGLVATAVE